MASERDTQKFSKPIGELPNDMKKVKTRFLVKSLVTHVQNKYNCENRDVTEKRMKTNIKDD